ncbi:MAG: TetR/AcrR family transcriptional regulator [Pseudomonadales bacterium]|nr:TetR/AcrR family transcriptional regulator [Pseudomonadales bacterium]
MAATARRALEKQRRYEDIVAAAEQAFFSQGYTQTSMDDIATGAALSRALLYVYFKDKAAIMRAVMLKACQRMLSRFEEAAERADKGADKVRAIGQAYYRYSEEDSDYFDVMTDLSTFPMPEEPDEVTLGLQETRQRVHALMVAAIRCGLDDHSINPERVHDPDLTAQILRGSLHGVIMYARQPKDPDELINGQAMVDEAIDMMCYAMTDR